MRESLIDKLWEMIQEIRSEQIEQGQQIVGIESRAVGRAQVWSIVIAMVGLLAAFFINGG